MLQNNANMEEDKKILLSLQRNIDIDEPSAEDRKLWYISRNKENI